MAQSQQVGMVLIHGAGLGAWIWDDILQRIDVPKLAIDLLDKPVGELNDSSLDDYVTDVIHQIETAGLGRVIIVAHSLGGVVGLAVASKLSDRLAGFVAVGAALPRPGRSFVSVLPFPQKFIMPLILKKVGTRPPVSAIRSGLCNDLTAEQTQTVVDRYQPESLRVYLDAVEYQPLQVPSLYICSTDDKEFPATLQRKMASALPNVAIQEISSGHLPMLSKPTELADALNNFVQKQIL